ncbi:MAG: hypothetical protein HKN35_07220 [Woeseia sp.]|nr:hypothetical protein [Woeseia sp.]MBT8097764.1 hypothetical protein [Woeseia sp.]NNE60666.1 hypothetical protein [Woeseia sp.]NNL54572.1 hypothetical protein [Woeseia sp.]
MRKFIEELRYRNVFRVAAAYLVIGWLIAQVADLATDAFNAPDWIMQLLITALLLGLPVALFLAWAFELTPEGIVRADELPETVAKDPRAGRLLDIIIISTLTVAVLLLGYDKLQRSAVPVSNADEKSIAVLPFDDYSPGGDQAWFADGLAEEILNSLARTTDLQVASRTSSFAFRDATHDIPTIAASLGVAHILEGSVRRAGDRLRVTAQLIRADDDKHLWSRTFDGTNEDSISIQEEVAFQIANALKTAMNPEELARMLSGGTRSVEAWETYLKGLALDYEVASQMDMARMFDVIAVFDKAVELDPRFADAHLMLADLWEGQLNPTGTAYSPDGPPYAERKRRYDMALEAASKYARSEYTRVEAEMRAAFFDVRIVDQIVLAKRMTEIEPTRRSGWEWLQYLYMISGNSEGAREAGLTAWDLEPDVGESGSVIITNITDASLDDALRMVDESLNAPNPPPIVLYQSHRVLLEAGQIERAATLVNAYAEQSLDEEGTIIMRVRQACAEGQVDQAEALFANVNEKSNSRWLFLKLLGRDDEARELLRPLDKPETLSMLAGYLTYLYFEPRDYPLLWKTLSDQGIDRPLAQPLSYRCKRKDNI